MARTKKVKEVEITADDLLSPETSIEITPEVVAVIKKEVKEKVLLGYHPITGAEVWKE